MRTTEPLLREHQELLPHIEALREAADAVSQADKADLRAKVEESFYFLTRHLIPHAEAEDAALYPVVGRVMGSALATATMSRDHVEVGRLTSRLGEMRTVIETGDLDESSKSELRAILYGLYALVKLHFSKEEEIYLPLLEEKLDAASAKAMFEDMESAAAEAKAKALD